jgi:hypothetical protein
MTAPALPAAPVLGFSFTSFSTNNPNSQQPGANLDAEFNRTNGAIGAILTFLQVSLNADGTLNSAQVEQAAQAAAGGNPNTGGVNVADAPSALSALLAQAWAEYMPGELPPDTLAGSGITGDHWSARWWANQASQAVAGLTAASQAATMEAAAALAAASSAQDTAAAALQQVEQNTLVVNTTNSISEQAYIAAGNAEQSVQALGNQLALVSALFQDQVISFLQLFGLTLPTDENATTDFWNNGGAICFTKNSNAAANFPSAPPVAGSGILWNNGGQLCIA